MIGFALPRDLPRTRLLHPRANDTAAVPLRFVLQLALAQTSHWHVHIDAIKQGAGDLVAVASNLVGRAAAAIGVAAVIAARAGVHC